MAKYNKTVSYIPGRATKPAGGGKSAGQIKISQCMIAKNEADNIRKSLGCLKGIAFEQIVVDTGSTDDTVKIAREMGATVYYFDWINDFSAAKNFAIDKAAGNWIVFLDADEYFSDEDAKSLPAYLNRVENAQNGAQIEVIKTRLVNLNDDGNILTIGEQIRIFRNKRNIRYHGAIHETLSREDGICSAYIEKEKLTIFHTGYSRSAKLKTNKMNRNIEILKKRLEQDPDDADLLFYIGNSYMGNVDFENAALYYKRALELNDKMGWFVAVKTRQELGNILPSIAGSTEEEAIALYNDSIALDATIPDYEYNMALWYLKLKQLNKAMPYLENTLEKLNSYNGDAELMCVQKLDNIYANLLKISLIHNDAQRIVKYATLKLKRDKYNLEVIELLLTMLLKTDKASSADDVLAFISKLYDFDLPKDKLFVYKAAQLVGDEAFTGLCYELFSDDEKAILNKRAKGVE